MMRFLVFFALVACSDLPASSPGELPRDAGSTMDGGEGMDAALATDAGADALAKDGSMSDAGSKACGASSCGGGAACCSENQGNGVLVCRAPSCNMAAGGDAVIECTSPTDCGKPQVCCALFAPGAIGSAFTKFACVAPENCIDETGWSVCTTQDDCPSATYRCKKLDMNSPVSWCMPTF